MFGRWSLSLTFLTHLRKVTWRPLARHGGPEWRDAADSGEGLGVAKWGRGSAYCSLAVSAVLAAAAVGLESPAEAATPLAVWHMDEQSGLTMEDAVGGLDGDVHGGVTVGAEGLSGPGYAFDGKSGYVSVSHADALNPGAADFSITLSFRTTSLPAKADWDLARKGYYTTVGGEWKVELQPSGQASCGFKGSLRNRFLAAGPTTLADGSWHTVTCTKHSSSIVLVVDGQTFSKSGKAGTISNTEDVEIGAYPRKEFFKGTLDEVSISAG